MTPVPVRLPGSSRPLMVENVAWDGYNRSGSQRACAVPFRGCSPSRPSAAVRKAPADELGSASLGTAGEWAPSPSDPLGKRETLWEGHTSLMGLTLQETVRKWGFPRRMRTRVCKYWSVPPPAVATPAAALFTAADSGGGGAPTSTAAREDSARRSSCFESLVKERCRSGDPPLQLDEALRSFDILIETTPPPSIHAFRSLLSALARQQQHAVVLSLYNRMGRRGIGALSHHPHTCCIVTNCCCELGRVDIGLGIYGKAVKLGVVLGTSFFTTVIKGLCTEGRVGDAITVFERMPELGCPWDDYTYATLVKGLCRRGQTSTALEFLRRMAAHEGPCKPGVITYSTVLDSLCKEGAFPEAHKLFEEMMSSGISPNVVTYSCMIHSYSISGCWTEAIDTFKEMVNTRGIAPNVVTFSTLVNSLCIQGRVQEAHNLFDLMTAKGVKPNTVTYGILLKGYCLVGRIHDAVRVFDTMVAGGLPPALHSYGLLIN
ncbi:hypothetical protein Taro_056412, partial [Colocasia esculenta]|nr:hypothetical protein [Colocasia esculenta]